MRLKALAALRSSRGPSSGRAGLSCGAAPPRGCATRPAGKLRPFPPASTRTNTACGCPEIPPPSGYQVFAPTIDTFLKEHLFCDIFIRDNLTHKQRELATIGALGAMTGTAGQLNFHLGAALNTGTTPEEMRDYLVEIERAAGAGQAELARGVLENILAKRRPS